MVHHPTRRGNAVERSRQHRSNRFRVLTAIHPGHRLGATVLFEIKRKEQAHENASVERYSSQGICLGQVFAGVFVEAQLEANIAGPFEARKTPFPYILDLLPRLACAGNPVIEVPSIIDETIMTAVRELADYMELSL